MSRVVLVDFETNPEGDIELYRPIGVVLVSPDGRDVEVRYTDEAADEPSDNYLRTTAYLQPHLDEWRHGQADFEWRDILVRMVEGAVLTLRFHTIATVPDEMTIDEAYERFVLQQEPLPDTSDEELQ